MNTRFVHDYYGILNELEGAFCIDGQDYANRSIDVAFSNIFKRLQRQYHIDLTVPRDLLYSTESVGAEVKPFLDNMYYLYCKLAGLAHFIKYSGQNPFSLSKINYLGVTPTSFKAFLKFLQLDGKNTGLDDSIERIKVGLGTVSMCNEKKLVMILCLAYELQLYELVAVIAEILYMEV